VKRSQFWDATAGKSRYKPGLWRNNAVIGEPGLSGRERIFARWEIWGWANFARVDYLLTRPGSLTVSEISITGDEAAAAFQAALIAALDERIIKVAVPSCYIRRVADEEFLNRIFARP